MRVSARIIAIVVLLFLLGVTSSRTPAFAQTTGQTITAQSSNQAGTNTNNFLSPNVDNSVPQNHHEYTQVVLIDVLSAVMCQLSGIDPTNPNQPCLGVDPTTGKIGIQSSTTSAQFGQAQNIQPQVGGAVGLMTNYIAALYIPAVSTSQYTQYLADNFGIVRKTYAAGNQNPNCKSANFGYGFCGLSPIFNLWTGVRDISYAMLTVLFIVIGLGVMLRFRVDPRTVMTLQNQIPRVIVAIVLITFSYAIAGGLIDLMWTATYAGINFISQGSSSTIELCPPNTPQPISQVVEQRLLDQPLSFTNTLFRGYGPNSNKNYCDNGTQNGLLTLSSDVSSAFGDLVTRVVTDLLNIENGCSFNWNPFHDIGCIATDAFGKAILWITEQLIKLIILITILIALFRLWYQLIKTYLTFIIFVILGPIWIVMGLIPGRPLGFEKWLRIIFTNLAIFPLVAMILTFGRVIIDALPQVDPQQVFVPPLIGNPNVSTFAAFMGFGVILLAPSLPDLLRERMKAKGQANFGAIAAGGLAAGAAVMSSPGKRIWEGLNRRNPTTQEPEGPLAIMKQRAWEKTPFGRRAVARKNVVRRAHTGGQPLTNYGAQVRAEVARMRGARQNPQAQQAAQNLRTANPSAARRAGSATGRTAGRAVGRIGRLFGRGGSQPPTPPPTPPVQPSGRIPTPPRPTMHPGGGSAAPGRTGTTPTPPVPPSGGTTPPQRRGVVRRMRDAFRRGQQPPEGDHPGDNDSGHSTS